MQQSRVGNDSLQYVHYMHIHISDTLRVSLRPHSGVMFILNKPYETQGKNSGWGSVTMNPNYNHVKQDKDFKQWSKLNENLVLAEIVWKKQNELYLTFRHNVEKWQLLISMEINNDCRIIV